jgi:3-hydroxyisobutyrate dehydrogenase
VSTIERIGFVGLGNMGAPMVRNLARAGFELTLRDADLDRQSSLAEELAAAAADGPESFGSVEAVVTMLPTGADVRSVLLDWQGGLAAALEAGSVVVDMSSSVPTGTRELGAALAARGIPLVDAPVSGGVPRAETGELAIMVGSDDELAVERVRPVLEAMGSKLFPTGPLGTGHAMKALNNIVGATAFAVVCEALIVGTRFGLDPAVALEVLNASTGRSFQTETNIGPHVLGRNYGTGFALPLMTKDVTIAGDLADALGVDAPTCRLMRELWNEALESEGATDFTAAVRYWEKRGDTELPLHQS